MLSHEHQSLKVSQLSIPITCSSFSTILFSRISPNSLPDKDKYIDLERRRWAAFLNVPISDGAPANFPANTLSTGRILTAISVSHPQSLPAALALFWQNYWVAGIDPTTPDAALAIVTAVLGKEEAVKIIEASKSGEIKGKLMKTTEWAINEGAFGVPWFIGEFSCS
jgi:2-hydroxychromene-2-carboxylate isomerase